jgi:hypothetical protein
MNNIFEQLQQYMQESLRKALPGVKVSDLEKDGAVFYMNGKNGTAFDWYVNEHFPDFFIFYGDRENLGAVKAMLYTDGALAVYVYGDKGHGDPVCFEERIEAAPEELLCLAALLTENADGRSVWDEDIRKLDADGKADKESVDSFLSLRKDHEPMMDRKKLFSKTVIVSKKVREGGWKIGYGVREEPTRDTDSGWYFCVGDETDEYVNDSDNLELWTVNSALFYEPLLNGFIDAPYGTAIVRVSSKKFEFDAPGKRIHIEKK